MCRHLHRAGWRVVLVDVHKCVAAALTLLQCMAQSTEHGWGYSCCRQDTSEDIKMALILESLVQ